MQLVFTRHVDLWQIHGTLYTVHREDKDSLKYKIQRQERAWIAHLCNLYQPADMNEGRSRRAVEVEMKDINALV